MTQIWWGEAPERPESINEASDVAELQAHARPMRVPSRGSAMSLVSRFGARNGRMHRPNKALHLVHTLSTLTLWILRSFSQIRKSE